VTKKDKKEWKRLCACLDPELFKQLRILAANYGFSMSEMTRYILNKYINKGLD